MDTNKDEITIKIMEVTGNCPVTDGANDISPIADEITEEKGDNEEERGDLSSMSSSPSPSTCRNLNCSTLKGGGLSGAFTIEILEQAMAGLTAEVRQVGSAVDRVEAAIHGVTECLREISETKEAELINSLRFERSKLLANRAAKDEGKKSSSFSFFSSTAGARPNKTTTTRALLDTKP